MEQEKGKRRKRCHAAAARVGSVAFTQLGSRRSLNYMVVLVHVKFFYQLAFIVRFRYTPYLLVGMVFSLKGL